MQSSILDTTVSCFRDYSTPSNPQTVNLLHWLTSKKYADKVEQIRAIKEKSERDTLKATQPAITPHGIFSYRSEKHLLQHSGFLQLDIDFKENSHVTNYSDLKGELCKLVNVAYCGLSVSGTGYCGLIPIAYPDKHRQHFDYIYNAFKAMGIVIDRKPRNVAALRGYSYDTAAYFNHHAKPLEKYHTPPPPKRSTYQCSDTDTQSQVESLINLISSRGIDIAPNYDQWLSIGFALASAFGEGGRQYFHEVSQHYSDYHYQTADRQFDSCLTSTGSGITIKSFFHLCKLAGVELTKTNHKESDTVPCFEVLKDGTIIELTRYGYPAAWDHKPAPLQMLGQIAFDKN